MDKVICIIPVYKVEHYLSKCLDSVFNQSYKNIDVICVNDGSTDASLEILKKYQINHNNLTIVNKKNGGLSSARNAGLKAIKNRNAKYLIFVDSDDYLSSDYVKQLVNFAERNNVDVVCSSFLFYKEGKSYPYKNLDHDILLSGFEVTKLLLEDETIQSHAHTKLYKFSLWNNMFFNEDIKFMEDQELIYRIIYKANNVFVTNYAGYYYRQDNVNALTRQKPNNRKIISGLKAYYYPCLYDFKEEDREMLISAAQHGLAPAYLMLIPHFKKKEASQEDKNFIKELKTYIKKNKIIKKYQPNNKNNAFKRKLYLLSPVLYPILFKIAKRLSR